MMRRIVFILVLILSPATLPGQLASPGKLSVAHSKLEGVDNCSKCHDFGKKNFQSNCLACHSEIGTRIKQKRGFHFYTRKLECSTCHKEHHGRSFKLIRWKPKSFDHRQSGFILKGAHDKVGCRKCHNPNNINDADVRRRGKKYQQGTYLGLSTDCSTCHADEHRRQFSDCSSCHGNESWKEHRFSHSKSRFPLVGKHQTVPCAGCHPQREDGRKIHGDTKYLQFDGIAFGGCLDCHEDKHNGAFGRACKSCHTPLGWKRVRISEGAFDHNSTRFPLSGKHAALRCGQCHKGGDYGSFRKADLSRCSTCHRSEHAGQFSVYSEKDCSDCHNVKGFAPALYAPERHAETRFKLEGSHQAVPCIRCHIEIPADAGKTRRFHWDNIECQTCHENPHEGQLDKRVKEDGCIGCHDIESWMVLDFDHSKTEFPLSGRHRTVLCSKCHVPGGTDGSGSPVFRITDRSCEACHQDGHAGQFAAPQGRTSCERCHSTSGWGAAAFDHNKMSDFPLTGKHKSVPCERCHPPVKHEDRVIRQYKAIATKCSSCHRAGG